MNDSNATAPALVLQLKTPYQDGTTHIVMSPLEFLQRLAAPSPAHGSISFASMLAEMNTVRQELHRQKDKGRKDSWALADLARAGIFCGDDAEVAVKTALKDLEERTAAATFYESAFYAVNTLVEEGLGQGKELGARLEDFKRVLQRKGGIAGH